ncbi:MAG: GntR family transcriptional regulator [Butyrivibrio sp.]|nr:GntR family transcriptional regulator [Butyrivibrio sp.]
MNIIDYHDSRPIYEQIVENFKLQILKGILRADEQMPSVRSLAIELSTNPNTVQKAYAELERQGFIYTVKGRGNFVKNNTAMIDNKRRELICAIIELLKEAEDIGIPVGEILEEIKNEVNNLNIESDKFDMGGRA